MDPAALSSLIARIYDTALDPDRWPDLLDEVGHALGGSGAIIFEMVDQGAKPRIIAPYCSAAFNRDLLEGYLTLHRDQDLKDQDAFARISGPDPEIRLVSDLEIAPSMEALLDQENVHTLVKHGLKHRSGAVLNKDSWNVDRFAVQYRNDRGPSTDEEKKMGSILLPHVSKALRIGRPLIPSREDRQEVQKRLDKLHFGVGVMGPDHHMLLTNAEFERIIDAHDVFRISPTSKLLLRADGVAKRFDTLVGQDAAHGKTGAYPRRQSLSIQLDRSEGALFIEICPANEHPSLGKMPSGSRLITVLDTSQSHQIDTELVTRFFPLSKSETAILALIAQGHSNTEIAEIRGRALETVNSQTKALLRKTWTRNRTELVQLALSLKSPFSLEWLR